MSGNEAYEDTLEGFFLGPRPVFWIQEFLCVIQVAFSCVFLVGGGGRGVIQQVCVPRGTKDICLVPLSDRCIMLHITHPDQHISVFFSSLMGCRSQSSSTLSRHEHAARCLSTHPCAITGNLTNPYRSSAVTSDAKHLCCGINKLSGWGLHKLSLHLWCSLRV